MKGRRPNKRENAPEEASAPCCALADQSVLGLRGSVFLVPAGND